MSLDCAHCPVRDQAACASLDPDQRARVAALGHHRAVARGETVFGAGDSADACATLITGALKIAQVDSEGTERILSLVHPAGFVGELFAPVARHDVIALTESRLCLFSRSQMDRLLADFPQLTAALFRRASDDLFESRQLIDLMGRRNARARVAGLLLAFARAASQSPCHAATAFDLPLTRGEMAGLLGPTIETVSRQLGLLEQEGAIARQGRRGLVMTDPAALEAMVD